MGKEVTVNSLGGQQWLIEADSRIWQCITDSMGEELEGEEKNQ